MTEEFVENYRGWNIYYGAVVATEQDEEGNWHDIIGYTAYLNGAAQVVGRTLDAVKWGIDKWIGDKEEKNKEEEGKIPPSACLIAFLFGSTVLKSLFPYFRLFRDRVMPTVTVNKYYVISGWCLKKVTCP